MSDFREEIADISQLLESKIDYLVENANSLVATPHSLSELYSRALIIRTNANHILQLVSDIQKINEPLEGVKMESTTTAQG